MSAEQVRRGRTGGWAGVALLALGILGVGGMGAAAAAAVVPGDAVFIGSKQGYGGTGMFPIWSDGLQVGDPDYWAYCIEHDVTARTGLLGTAGDMSSYLGANYFTAPAVQGKVLWVLAHSYPAVDLESFGAAAGVPALTRNDAIEAAQYAIWRYTDLTFDAAWAWETPESEAAYWYLVNGANASPGLTPADFVVDVDVSVPGAAQTAGTLVGPVVVNTDQASVAVSVNPAVSVTDAAGQPVDLSAVVDGAELYLDLRATTAGGSATVRATAQGSSSTGQVISVPNAPGGTPTAADHAQSIILVAPQTTGTTAEAVVQWAAQPGAVEPAIGTSLVDAADGDRVLSGNGGTVIDTVSYRDLVPGNEYTVSGELMDKADGGATGITGSTTFIPTSANGSIDVTFSVPAEFAGTVLVAFEWLFDGADGVGEPIAVHTDLDDAAQTVTVQPAASSAPTVPAPTPARGGVLAATGSSVPVEAVAGAVLALLIGGVLLRARRRRLDA